MTRFDRSRTTLVLLALSAALLGASRMPWLRVTLNGAVRDDVLTAAAPDLAPVVPAAALVGLAGSAALSIAGRRAARVVLLLITAAGLLGSWGCLSVLTDPRAGVRGMLSGRVITSATSSLTPAVWGALACALAMAVLSAVAWRAVPGWADRRTSGSRFDRDTAEGDQHSPAADWDALSRGEDPTH